MDLNSIVYVLLGSTVGLLLRMFVQYKVKIKTGFYINNTSLVNILASLFLGILLALNIIHCLSNITIIEKLDNFSTDHKTKIHH